MRIPRPIMSLDRSILRSAILCPLATLVAVCNGGSPTHAGDEPEPPPHTDQVEIPLTELGAGTYLGFAGGLYPTGRNEPPTDHAAAGRAALARIQPLDEEGRPSGNGKVVLVSVGMSNTSQAFCSESSLPPCRAWTFMGQAAADPAVNRTTLVIVNGAHAGQTAETWDSPTEPNFDRVRDSWLTPLGVTERQVQVAWVKQANPRPSISLPDPDADAYELERSLGDIVRAMKVGWPNLGIVFVEDGTHPSRSGEQKVGRLLLDFFKTSPFAQ